MEAPRRTRPRPARLAGLAAVAILGARPAAGQTVSGFIQIDHVRSADSSDQLDDGTGLPLNRDRVLVRRARVRIADRIPMGQVGAEYVTEAELSTVAGPQITPRHVEGALNWSSHPTEPEKALHLRLGAGIFHVPFGHDVYELGHAERLFTEPSLLATALFPGELDVGARVAMAFRAVSLVVAVQNGEPLGSRAFPGRDPNGAKDVFVRAAARAFLGNRVAINGGTSLTFGRGFHPGTPATKDTLVWRDFNEDGIAQPFEIQVIRGAAATPSEEFERWGMGADLRLRVLLRPGVLSLSGEAALATNLDRGVRPADPVLLGIPQRGVAVTAAVTQELGRRVLIGGRYDLYQPSLDSSEVQGGSVVRSVQRFTNLSFAAALVFGQPGVPHGRARLVVDYTMRRDPLARDAAGHPTDLANDTLTLRLQLES